MRVSPAGYSITSWPDKKFKGPRTTHCRGLRTTVADSENEPMDWLINQWPFMPSRFATILLGTIGLCFFSGLILHNVRRKERAPVPGLLLIDLACASVLGAACSDHPFLLIPRRPVDSGDWSTECCSQVDLFFLSGPDGGSALTGRAVGYSRQRFHIGETAHRQARHEASCASTIHLHSAP